MIGGLMSCTFSSCWILLLTKTGYMTVWVFRLRCCRYFSWEKTIKQSHSSEKYDQQDDKRYAQPSIVFGNRVMSTVLF